MSTTIYVRAVDVNRQIVRKPDYEKKALMRNSHVRDVDGKKELLYQVGLRYCGYPSSPNPMTFSWCGPGREFWASLDIGIKLIMPGSSPLGTETLGDLLDATEQDWERIKLPIEVPKTVAFGINPKDRSVVTYTRI